MSFSRLPSPSPPRTHLRFALKEAVSFRSGFYLFIINSAGSRATGTAARRESPLALDYVGTSRTMHCDARAKN